jgi:hypothetical protein
MAKSIFFNKNKYISSKRSAELSGYTSDYISRFCKEGKLKAQKFGKAWYIEEKALFEFIKDRDLEKRLKNSEKAKRLRGEYELNNQMIYRQKWQSRNKNVLEKKESLGSQTKEKIKSLTQPLKQSSIKLQAQIKNAKTLSPYVSKVPALLSNEKIIKGLSKGATLALSASLVFGVFFFYKTPYANHGAEKVADGLNQLTHLTQVVKIRSTNELQLAKADIKVGFSDSRQSMTEFYSDVRPVLKRAIVHGLEDLSKLVYNTPNLLKQFSILSYNETKAFAVAMHFAFNDYANDYKKSLSTNLNVFTGGLTKARPIALKRGLDSLTSLNRTPIKMSENLASITTLYGNKTFDFIIDLPNKMINFGYLTIKESDEHLEKTRTTINNFAHMIKDTAIEFPGGLRKLSSNLFEEVSGPINISLLEINKKIIKGKENIGRVIRNAPVFISLALDKRMESVPSGGEQTALLVKISDNLLNSILRKISLNLYLPADYFLNPNPLCSEKE